MDIFLQTWGGIFYLLAKIFLSIAEGKENSKCRIAGWVIYLLGVPPWVIILALNRNWIAMAIEAGAVPALILGVVIVIKQLKQAPAIPDKSIRIFTWLLIAFAILYSMYDYGGINRFSQILEFGVTVGFLLGSYLLSKKDRRGWLCYLLMNLSMGTLMFINGKFIFAFLQLISIIFVMSGFIRSRKNIIQ